MRADVTRQLHDRRKPFAFSKVYDQQGRLTLDADRNLAQDIAEEWRLAADGDAIGPSGTPKRRLGFKPMVVATPAGNVLAFTPGRHYVEGILCEADGGAFQVVGATHDRLRLDALARDGVALAPDDVVLLEGTGIPPRAAHVAAVAGNDVVLTGGVQGGPWRAVRRMVTLGAQPDRRPGSSLLAPPANTNASDLLYLDVTETHVSALEDPTLLEPALGGADTTTRARNAWRLHVLRLPGAAACTDEVAAFEAAAAPSRARLSTDRTITATAGTLCQAPVAAAVPANGLYRIEVHEWRSDGRTLLKWSRANSAVAFRVAAIETDAVVLASLGRDETLGLAKGDWVELTDRWGEAEDGRGLMLQVRDVHPVTRRVQFESPPNLVASAYKVADGALLRRWDQRGAALSGGLVAALPDQPFELEDGLTATLDGGLCRPGDYWTVAVRADAPAFGRLQKEPPRGPRRRAARLGLVQWSGGTPTAVDCRKPFPALSELMAEDVGYVDTHKLGADNVQAALDQLRVITNQATLRFLGGDGQQGEKDADLAAPLEIGVEDAQGRPVHGTIVAFTATAPDTLVSLTGVAPNSPNTPATTVQAVAVNGVAKVRWRPGATGFRAVTARLRDAPPQGSHLGVSFHAMVHDAPLRVAGVSWPHGGRLNTQQLASGLRVTFDAPLHPRVAEQRSFILEVEAPIEAMGAGKQGATAVPGMRNLVRVEGTLALENGNRTLAFLPADLQAIDRWHSLEDRDLLCRVRLVAGSTVDATGTRHLDGTTMLRPGGNGLAPTYGAGRAPHDLEGWFTLGKPLHFMPAVLNFHEILQLQGLQAKVHEAAVQGRVAEAIKPQMLNVEASKLGTFGILRQG